MPGFGFCAWALPQPAMKNRTKAKTFGNDGEIFLTLSDRAFSSILRKLMIQTLRNAHRLSFVVLAVLLPAILARR
jgi:hypothetical protein